MAPTLCGCVTDGTSGTPKLAVNLSALQVCETILKDVPLPAVTAATDARVAWARDELALAVARGEITNARNCVVYVRRRYAEK